MFFIFFIFVFYYYQIHLTRIQNANFVQKSAKDEEMIAYLTFPAFLMTVTPYFEIHCTRKNSSI